MFSLLYGEADVATALAGDPRIAAVGFTGSARAGTALVAVAAARAVPVPVFAEMSSVNPVVLLPGALAERAADLGRDLVASLTTGSGQLCTCPGVVLAARGSDLDAFLASAAEAVRDQHPTPMLGPSVHGGYLAGLDRLDAAGATLVAEGAADDVRQAGRARLFTADAGAVADDPRLREEVFGPAALVVVLDRLESADDVTPLLSALGGQLTATLHVGDGDLPLARALVPHLERLAGRIVTGGWPTGVEVVPAMVHGGPFPATSDPRFTSVGTTAIGRFQRPVAYQGFPDDLLPSPFH